jgi:protein CpxP
MNKLTLVSLLALGLVLVNLVLIFQQTKSHSPRHPKPHEGPRNEIIKRLQFDQAQIASYDSLIREHRKAIRSLDSQLALSKKMLYSQLVKPQSERLNDSLLKVIADKNIEIERVHFAHFEDIHTLCKPNQEAHFEELVQDLQHLFNRKPPMGK